MTRADAVTLRPVGWVRGGRSEPDDDGWGDVACAIALDPARYGPEALLGLDTFSHAVVVFLFDRIDEASVATGARRPRGNPDWPAVGIFAQRGSPRPNRLGVTTVELLGVEGLELRVRGLDAVDGTPVLDIKPAMTGFEPRGPLREPDWARAIMQAYW